MCVLFFPNFCLSSCLGAQNVAPSQKVVIHSSTKLLTPLVNRAGHQRQLLYGRV